MPVYEYACTDCGTQIEVRQSFTDDPLTVCQHCGGRLRKVLSPVGVVFKGSGFYRTDSRSTNGDGKGAGKKEASSTGSGSSDASSTGSGADSAGKSGGSSESKSGKPSESSSRSSGSSSTSSTKAAVST